MNKCTGNSVAAAAAAMLLFAAACTGSEPPMQSGAAGVDPKADRIVRDTSKLLASSTSFTFTVDEVAERVRRNGQKEPRQLKKEVSVRRPDRFHMKITGADRVGSAVYDGKAVTLIEPAKKMYAQANAPPTLDETLDVLAARFDIPMPTADLIYSDMYTSVITPDTKGQYLGEETINGSACHHLSFQAELVDWQIWIATGDKPLPCQLEIIYKDDEALPKTKLTYSDWVLDVKLDDAVFAFTPPADYQRIRIAKRSTKEDETPTEEPTHDAKK